MTATVSPLRVAPSLTRDRYHRYTFTDAAGTVGPMPSVTSILKVQEALGGSDGLVKWAAGIAVDHFADGIRVMDVHSSMAEAINLRAGAIAATDGPANTGSGIHEQVRRVLQKQPLILSDGKVEYADHLAQFAAFMGTERPEVFFTEEMVANLDLEYGGAFDILGNVRGKLALIDVKTGKLKATHRLQLAGYQDATFIGRDGEKIPMPKVEAGYVLLLRPDGWELVDMTPAEADLDHWRFLADAHRKLAAWAKEDRE